MFYGQKIIALMIGFGAVSLSFAEVDRQEKRADMAFRHVMFEQYQEEFRAAYIAADYYRAREIDNESMTLAKAAASLEMGYLDHVRALIDGLDEFSLLPENQSRLRLYLARDAYRRRDWPLLGEHLEALADLELASATQHNHQRYLQLEYARYQGDLTQAYGYLSSLDEDFPLRYHAMFNLAVVALSTGRGTSNPQDPESGVNLLKQIAEGAPQDLAQLMLMDRARVALAEVYIKQQQPQLARQQLVKVSAHHQYGPGALAQLARLHSDAEDYEHAAAIWQHLNENFPWHEAATHALSGLGYAMQMSRGDEAAFAIYSDGLEQMLTHHERLEIVASDIEKELHDPKLFNQESEALLTWLSDALGHDDWLTWFSSAEVRSDASRWQALDEAHRKLKTDQTELDALLLVDAEQQRRVARMNESVANDQLAPQLKSLTAALEQRKASLVNRRFVFSDDLSEFTSHSQNLTLDDIAYVQAQLQDLPEVASPKLNWRIQALDRRIGRLQGKVRYEIFHDVPVKKQRRIAELDRQLAFADASNARLQRIEQAAVRQPESVSQRIAHLAASRQQLEQETLLAVQAARQQLLASLQELIRADQVRLGQQIAGLQYDMTRLADRRMAGGAP